jgi:hypothetical protein
MVHSFVISLIFLLRCACAAAVVCVCLRHGATNLLLAVVSSLVALFGFQLPIDSRPESSCRACRFWPPWSAVWSTPASPVSSSIAARLLCGCVLPYSLSFFLYY